MSPHFHFRPINYGYYRIYWTGGGEPAYIHEVYKWMPYSEYQIEFKDPNVISQRYYEEYEDQLEVTRKIKNYVEGYVDSLDTMRKRFFQLKNDKEFRKTAVDAYKTVRLK